MKKILLAAAAILLLSAGTAGAVDGPYVYAATQHRDTVDVRFQAPEGGVLLLGVYHRSTHRMTGAETCPVAAGEGTRTVTVTFGAAIPSTEYVRAFLLSDETYQPLCQSVLSDYVMS